jgi:peptidoglycan-associated lipoprotein
MNAFLKGMAIGSLGLALIVAGCAKKVTKIEPPVPSPAVAEETPPPPPPPPAAPPAPDVDSMIRANLQKVYFDYDQANLRSDAVQALSTAAPFLKEQPAIKVMLEGNCDERGSSEYNMALGENRAKAVKQYLISYGIDASRIETTSYGKERLMSSGCTDESCHQQNRRVEWTIRAR